MEFKTLYQDENYLVIDKPSGIEVADLAGKYFPGKILAHRLDTGTSGALVLAKSEKAREFLKKQFSAPALEIAKRGLADKQARVKKTYIAIVNGWPKADTGKVDKPIGRSPADFRRRLSGRGVRGKIREAVTEWRVLKRLTLPLSPLDSPSPKNSLERGHRGEGKFALLEIRPKTGRTHQIRVHMKFANYPVACDPLYDPGGACPAGLERLALHARAIEFKNLDGKVVKIESPLPQEFQKY